MILTVTGLVAIEHIRAGDKVISANPETFETADYDGESSVLVHNAEYQNASYHTNGGYCRSNRITKLLFLK